MMINIPNLTRITDTGNNTYYINRNDLDNPQPNLPLYTASGMLYSEHLVYQWGAIVINRKQIAVVHTGEFEHLNTQIFWTHWTRFHEDVDLIQSVVFPIYAMNADILMDKLVLNRQPNDWLGASSLYDKNWTLNEINEGGEADIRKELGIGCIPHASY